MEKYCHFLRVLCDESGKIWVSGSDSKIYQIDQRGSILKTIPVFSIVSSFSVEKIFSLQLPDKKVYKYDGDGLRTVIDLGQWCPR